MRALDLLLKMQASHTHLALVIDEYGGTDGLVSIEDIIEEIVGDIADEHDDDPAVLKPDSNGVIADARMDLDDFKIQTGHDLLLEDTEDDIDIDSLGGLVVSLLGRVPQRGEIVNHPDGTEFLVLEADPRRVRKLRVTLPKSRATE
jgi:CBS domain containing-hemolysin-like protein